MMEIPDDSHDGADKSETENDNEVAKEVYSLSLHAGRPRQYLGSASGAILANLFPLGSRPKRIGGDSNNNDDEDEDYFRRFATADGQRYSSPEMAKTVLPAEPLGRSLLAAYLSHDHLAFPYLHPKKLINTLTSMYAEEKYYESHPVEAFSLDMIFAIATVQVHRFSWQSLPDAETYHERAISKLGIVLESGGLVALQTIMLLCQYRMLSVSYSTSASLWHLLGMATRLGIELGLHREAIYRVPVGLSPTNEDHVKQELGIKRRCFWSLFQMDRIVSNTLGRPVSINLLEIDTEHPAVEDDGDASWGPSPSVEDMLQYPHWPANTKIFNHITWHRIITGKILSNLHNVPKSRMPDPQTCLAIKQQLAEELDQWRAGVASLPLIDVSATRSKDKSNYRTREWYNLLYHNCILMLHRPIHSLQDIPQTSEVLTQIYYSSQQSISSYAELHKARKINYAWVTLHAVFLVGLSYVYALRTHFRNRRHQMEGPMDGMPPPPQALLTPEPSISQIVSDMRACSTVLVAISERWNTGRGCHEIFARLSDAVLADASEYFMGTKVQSMSSSNQEGGPNRHLLSGDQVSQQPPWPILSSDFDHSYQDYFGGFPELFGDHFDDNILLQPPFGWNFES
ncbi:Fungal specific transcription factor domain-containing protein [Cladophialophora immunda]|nr:Fungal specific transcription factor domain-containing protein [Cladophialophora immunda]